MIYNLKYNNLLSSKDGSLKNIQDSLLKEKRDNYRKSRDCGNCEKVCCDCCLC